MRKRIFCAAVPVLVLLAAAFMSAAGTGLDSCGASQVSSSDVSASTAIAADKLTINEGETLELEYTSVSDSSEWSSSDAETVSCLNGTVTAHKSGNAVITLSDGAASDSISITVVKNASADAYELVARLAETGAPIDELYDISSRLDNCTDNDLEPIHSVIDLLCSCAGDECDTDALAKAASDAGLDELTVLEAASYCWSAGQADNHTAVISFTGDVTIGRLNEQTDRYFFPNVYSSQDSLTYPFDRVKRFFFNDDLTVINFEGVLTESTHFVNKAFFFRGDPEYAAILPASGIDAATIANNHTFDYRQQGYNDTVKYLTEANVQTFDEGRPAEFIIHADDGTDITVALFAFNLIGNTRPTPEAEALELIKEYKTDPNTVVAASVHWGTEYQEEPNADQRNFGRALIDAGADIVVGHHPHIIQGIEYYNGKYLAFSLGNFSFAGNTLSVNPHSMILQANIDRVGGKTTVSGISVIPCYTTSSEDIVNNYQPCVQYGESSQEIMEILARRSSYTQYGAEELIWSGM